MTEGHRFKQFVFRRAFTELDADEAHDRGYLSHVLVETVDGRLYPVFFYDRVRFQQDLEANVTEGRPWLADPGMIVLDELTRPAMEAAARALCDEHFFSHLNPVTEDDLNRGDRFDWPPRRV